jgi:HEAT repeat protein
LAACCTNRSIEALLSKGTDDRARAALDRLGKHAPWDELIAVSSQGGEAVEAFVVASLARRKDERSPALLESAMSSSRAQVRIAALEVLAESSDPKVRQQVISALYDSSESVRAWAVSRLAKNASAACAHQILRKIHDPHAKVRAAVTRAIGFIRPVNSLELLTPMLYDSDAEVRSAAADTLSVLREAGAVPFRVVPDGYLGDDFERVLRVKCGACFGTGRRVLRGDGPGHRPVFAKEPCHQCGGNGFVS